MLIQYSPSPICIGTNCVEFCWGEEEAEDFNVDMNIFSYIIFWCKRFKFFLGGKGPNQTTLLAPIDIRVGISSQYISCTTY